jgi:hypothetical protein
MNKILDYLKNPLFSGIAGLIVGIVIGLFVLGWGLFPVEWTNAEPSDMYIDFQKDYLKGAIYSYSADGNKEEAIRKYEALGPNAGSVLDQLMMDSSIDAQVIAKFTDLIGTGTGTISTVEPGITQPPAAVVTPGTEKKGISSAILLAILCIVLLAIGGALVYILFIRKKGTIAQEYVPPQKVERPVRQQPQPVVPTKVVTSKPAPVEMEPEEQDIPVAQFMTTYMIGDDLYDDSFSIDSPTGEFLGECGVGISETIGVGDPKKVTAFEVWLFDKNDIQTITKVIMSEHAWNDVAISQRLAAKGEPVLMDAGKQIVLETASLILEARVVDVAYGQGALPAHSFFDRMTLELAIWTK